MGRPVEIGAGYPDLDARIGFFTDSYSLAWTIDYCQSV
jgi:hypothetical protein